MIVRTLFSADGLRRVDIVRRPGGAFGFEEARLDPETGSWVPFGRYADSFADTPERAVAEARGRVAWLSAAGEGVTVPRPPRRNVERPGSELQAFIDAWIGEAALRIRAYLAGHASHAGVHAFVCEAFDAWDRLPEATRASTADGEDVLWYALWTLQHVADATHWTDGVTQRDLRQCLELLEGAESLPEGYSGRRP